MEYDNIDTYISTMDEREANKRLSPFWKRLLIVLAAFALIVTIALIWWSTWLKDYEESQASTLVSKVITLFDSGNFHSIATGVDTVQNGLENVKDVAERIELDTVGKTVTFKKAFSYDRFEKPIFTIVVDGEDYCQVVLRKSGQTSKYGQAKYEVAYFTGFDFGIEPIELYAPEGSKIVINGIELEDDMFVERTISTAETQYALANSDSVVKYYVISGLTTLPTSFRAFSATGSEYSTKMDGADLSIEFVGTTISAPEGASVYVDDILLTSRYIVGSEEKVTDAATLSGEVLTYNLVTYKVEYLSTGAECRIMNGANEVLNAPIGDDDITMEYSTYKIYVPAGFDVTVDGQDLTGKTAFVTNKSMADPQLATIIETYLSNRPMVCEYTISSFGIPSVVAFNDEINEFLRFDNDSNNFYYSYTKGIDPSVRETLTKLAIERSEMYSKYITADVTKDEFLAQVAKFQPMYNELKDHPQNFYTGHKYYKFENETVVELNQYSENCFACEITYDHIISDIKTNHDFSITLSTHTRFIYAKVGAAWYMVDWEIMD